MGFQEGVNLVGFKGGEGGDVLFKIGPTNQVRLRTVTKNRYFSYPNQLANTAIEVSVVAGDPERVYFFEELLEPLVLLDPRFLEAPYWILGANAINGMRRRSG